MRLRYIIAPIQRVWNRIPKTGRVIIQGTSALVGVLTLSGLIYIAYLIRDAKQTTPDGITIYEGLKRRGLEPTFVRDAHGQILAVVSDKNEFDVSIEDMNPYLSASLIGVEDRRFRDHNGFDTKAIWRFLRKGVTGELTGMSTLGSQLFKEDVAEKDGSLHYYHQRLQQKIREWIQAQKLFALGDEAKRFGLERYLNNTYFVTDEKGVAAAAKIIFGKDQKDLTPDECALIVGLAQNPSRLNPLSTVLAYRQAAERRTDEVLRDLVRAYHEGSFEQQFLSKYPAFAIEEGVIDQAIEEVTTGKTLVGRYTKISTRPNYIPTSLLDILRRSQEQLFREISYQEDEDAITQLRIGDGKYKGMISRNAQGGLDTLLVREGGFTINTTIVLPMQQLLTNALDNHIKKLDVSWSYAEYPLNGAILCIENATGNIVGDVRKRDTDPKRIDFRHAHTEQGSVFKALVVVAALDLGVIPSLEEMYRDTAYTLTSEQYPGITDPEGWTPANFKKKYSNDTLSLGMAVFRDSRNSSIAYILQQAAIQGKGEQMLDRLYELANELTPGMYDHVSSLERNPQIGLGMLPADVDFVAAMYMAIANGGSIPETFTDIRSIGDIHGGIFYEAESPVFSDVYSVSVCNEMMPYLLEKGKRVTGKGNILAKSGTTGHANKVRMTCTTPRYTIVVRVGPEVYTADDGKTIIGRDSDIDATKLLSPLMQSILRDMEKQGLYDPDETYTWYTQSEEIPGYIPQATSSEQ